MKLLEGTTVLALGSMAERPLCRYLASLGATVMPGEPHERGIAAAQFLVDDLGIEGLADRGVTRAAIELWNPSLVHVSVTTFGSGNERSRWRGGELVASAMGGALRLTGEPDASVGDQIKADIFVDGDKIEVVGKSKGKGFAGTIKRHNFARGPESHGSMNVRAPGSIGQSAYPSRVIKGTRSSGHMGDEHVTVKGLTVAKVDAENNLIMIRGAVPGANGSVVIVKKS